MRLSGRSRVLAGLVVVLVLAALLGAAAVALLLDEGGGDGPRHRAAATTPDGASAPRVGLETLGEAASMGAAGIAPPAEVAGVASESGAAASAARGGEDGGAGPDGERGRRARAPGRLEGTVVDVDGAAIPGAKVKALPTGRRGGGNAKTPPPTPEAEVDGLGRFGVEVPAGPTVAWATAPGFAASATWYGEVPPGGTERTGPLVLRRARSALRVAVVDEQGEPLAAASIRCWADQRAPDEGGREGQTAADGTCALEGLAEGLYAVEARLDGHVRAFQDDVAVVEATGGEARLQLRRAARVEGRVLDPAGKPRGNASVFVYRGDDRVGQATTDDEGRFSAAGLEPGPADLFVRSDDYALSARVAVLLAAGALTAQDVALERGREVTGTLTSPDGAPCVNHTVVCAALDGDARRRARTDEQGRYVVGNLYPGRYRVLVLVAGDEQGGRAPEQPRAEGQVDVTTGPARLDLVVRAGAVLAGVVTGPDGQPLAGATVAASVPEGHRAMGGSDAQGAFRLAGLPPGTYRLLVRGAGDALVSVTTHDLGADQVMDGLRLVARAPAHLVGRVVDPDGQPLRAIEVQARGLGFPVQRDEVTDGEGRFVLGPLYDGEYALSFPDGPLALLARQRGAARAEIAATKVTIDGGRDATIELRVALTAKPD